VGCVTCLKAYHRACASVAGDTTVLQCTASWKATAKRRCCPALTCWISPRSTAVLCHLASREAGPLRESVCVLPCRCLKASSTACTGSIMMLSCRCSHGIRTRSPAIRTYL
jgi:hypothetical protein